MSHHLANPISIQGTRCNNVFCPILCNPLDCSPQGFSVHGIFQAILAWVAISFSRGSSWPRNWTRVSCVSCIDRWILYPLSHQGSSLINILYIKNAKRSVWVCAVQYLVTQPCPALCDPVDCSPPGSSVHGISQVRILGWVAISSSRGSFQPRHGPGVSRIAGGFWTIWATREAHMWADHFLSVSPFCIFIKRFHLFICERVFILALLVIWKQLNA